MSLFFAVAATCRVVAEGFSGADGERIVPYIQRVMILLARLERGRDGRKSLQQIEPYRKRLAGRRHQRHNTVPSLGRVGSTVFLLAKRSVMIHHGTASVYRFSRPINCSFQANLSSFIVILLFLLLHVPVLDVLPLPLHRGLAPR